MNCFGQRSRAIRGCDKALLVVPSPPLVNTVPFEFRAWTLKRTNLGVPLKVAADSRILST